ncbi:hypothetical protein [Pleurocapsa sp. CCALA 161]|uniref:hypothetical protein n=1 Tax=Pleurocapsa sp. CCALA 161 TaxID=2107688 RepID=UPI0013049D47|nr:hypothetical protein [Pleurocapsa sp. CCALA 161]
MSYLPVRVLIMAIAEIISNCVIDPYLAYLFEKYHYHKKAIAFLILYSFLLS